MIFEIEVYKKGVFEKIINFFVLFLIGIELVIGSLVIEFLFVKICLKYIWNWNLLFVFVCLFCLFMLFVFILIVDGGGWFLLKV